MRRVLGLLVAVTLAGCGTPTVATARHPATGQPGAAPTQLYDDPANNNPENR